MPLDVIVVGAGIAGLFTAIALSAHGHHVTVLEKQPTHEAAGGPIGLQPGAVRVMKVYGLGETFSKNLRQGPEDTWYWRRYDSGEVLIQRQVKSYAKTFGTESWSFTRQRLRDLLAEKAKKSRVDVRLGCQIAAVDEEGPAVRFADGSELRADLVVGADGIRSTVRNCVLPQDEAKVTTILRAWMVHIPLENLQQDPALLPYIQGVNFWLGPGHSITAATMPDNNVYNLTLFVEGGDDGGFEQVKQSFQNFEPTITRLLSDMPATERYLWRVSEVSPLPTWVSKSGRVVILGDAAHAMVPFAAQGASQCVEDAGALAECLSRHDEADIPKLLRIFEMIRKPRAESTAARSAARRVMYHLPNGPEQQARDGKMKRQVQSYEPDRKVWNGEHIDEPPDINSPLHDPYLMGHDVIDYVSFVPDMTMARRNMLTQP